jgi:hypothetical protein
MAGYMAVAFLDSGNIEERMLYKLGRFLQLVGLLLLPVAMAGQATESMSLWRMLIIAGVGVCVFGLGVMLQNAGKP